MPELPEVETIARVLRESGRVVGRMIREVRVDWPRSIAEPDAAEFSLRIRGQTIASISRRAKFLVFSLSEATLLLHLRMSGDVRLEAQESETQKHDRISLILDGGERLVFNDPRKFGRAWLLSDADKVLGGLGPEPMDPGLSAQEFHRRLTSKNRQIKPLLLDQTFLAGVGNIYSDEALHLAGIHPLTPSGRIDVQTAERLLAALRETLQEGIRRNGASIDWVYRGGEFQNYFRVYQREGQPCPECGTIVERRVIGQRSAHFCPVCQPAT